MHTININKPGDRRKEALSMESEVASRGANTPATELERERDSTAVQ